MATTTKQAPIMNGQYTPTPNVEMVHITPDLAAEYLTHNTHNRNLRERRVERYARAMAGGDWKWNGETIKFSTSGDLIDGQHRLHAIIRAEVTVPMLVVRGLEPEAQETVDAPIPRAFQDVLALRGDIDVIALAALVRKVGAWEAGRRARLDSNSFTTAELLRVLDQHPELRDITKDARRCAQGCGIPGSVIGLAWWVFSRIDEEDASFFFERLGDGQGLVKGDPIYELRRTFDQRVNGRSERRQAFLLVYLIKGWNAYREGRTDVAIYRWKPGGAAPEKFPEPV